MENLKKNVATAILRKMCKENSINFENVFISKFGYVETVNFSEKGIHFCKTEYKGIKYKVAYFDGCFKPFIVKEQTY